MKNLLVFILALLPINGISQDLKLQLTEIPDIESMYQATLVMKPETEEVEIVELESHISLNFDVKLFCLISSLRCV